MNFILIFQILKERGTDGIPPIFMSHGKVDDLVDFEWGKTTHSVLRGLNINIEFREYEDLGHELSPAQLKDVKQWITPKIPLL